MGTSPLSIDYSVGDAQRRLERLLNTISYKPNFSFRVISQAEHRYSPNHISWQIIARMPDTYAPDPKPIIKIAQMNYLSIPMLMSESESTIIDAIYHGIRALEDHESQEWFKVAGAMVYDPHAREK